MSSKGWTVHVHQLFAYSSTVLFKLLTALLRHNFLTLMYSLVSLFACFIYTATLTARYTYTLPRIGFQDITYNTASTSPDPNFLYTFVS